MKKLLLFGVLAFLFAACSRRSELQDDKMGAVSRVYKAVIFSAKEKQQPVFGNILTFVRVEPSGEVVMTFKKDKEYEVRGEPWHDLAGTAELGFPLHVLETSPSAQWAKIEYEAWTSRPRL